MITALDPARRTLLFEPPPATGRLSGWLREGANAALDLVYPPHCAACNEPLPPEGNKALCRICAEKIRWIGPDRCLRCGAAVGLGSGAVDDCTSCRTYPPAFVKASCAVAHYAAGPLRDLILALKFNGKLHVAAVFGALLAQRIGGTGLVTPDTLVVPTPLTRAASLQRGFNQAEEVAAWVARALKLRLEPRLLTKVRGTPPQATLSDERRRMNLKGAFACAPRHARRCKNARVLLIDDVITTGSTVSECARTLVQAGVVEVRAAAVARG